MLIARGRVRGKCNRNWQQVRINEKERIFKNLSTRRYTVKRESDEKLLKQ